MQRNALQDMQCNAREEDDEKSTALLISLEEILEC